MYHDFEGLWKKALHLGLTDDQANLDWTTIGALPSPDAVARARITAKAEGVWAADGLSAALEKMSHIVVRPGASDSARIPEGRIVCEWEGPAHEILIFERPYLNLASYACGIATATRGMVDSVKKACPRNTPRVTCTRKTLPGYRDLALQAVIAGGGHPHRVSLGGGVLIKENHIAVAGSIAAAVKGAREAAPHGLKIEVEVRDVRELTQALDCKIDGVLLDNFKPDQVRQALKKIPDGPGRPVVEVSGGLNDRTIASYAIDGVDILSVGSLTHSVQAFDLSLALSNLKKK